MNWERTTSVPDAVAHRARVGCGWAVLPGRTFIWRGVVGGDGWVLYVRRGARDRWVGFAYRLEGAVN